MKRIHGFWWLLTKAGCFFWGLGSLTRRSSDIKLVTPENLQIEISFLKIQDLKCRYIIQICTLAIHSVQGDYWQRLDVSCEVWVATLHFFPCLSSHYNTPGIGWIKHIYRLQKVIHMRAVLFHILSSNLKSHILVTQWLSTPGSYSPFPCLVCPHISTTHFSQATVGRNMYVARKFAVKMCLNGWLRL